MQRREFNDASNQNTGNSKGPVLKKKIHRARVMLKSQQYRIDKLPVGSWLSTKRTLPYMLAGRHMHSRLSVIRPKSICPTWAIYLPLEKWQEFADKRFRGPPLAIREYESPDVPFERVINRQRASQALTTSARLDVKSVDCVS